MFPPRKREKDYCVVYIIQCYDYWETSEWEKIRRDQLEKWGKMMDEEKRRKGWVREKEMMKVEKYLIE